MRTGANDLPAVGAPLATSSPRISAKPTPTRLHFLRSPEGAISIHADSLFSYSPHIQ